MRNKQNFADNPCKFSQRILALLGLPCTMGTATFSPSTLASTPNSGESVAYTTGTIESGPGATFVVSEVPEPSSLTLIGFGGALLLHLARRRKSNVI